MHSVLSSPKGSRLLTVVVTDRELTISEWRPYSRPPLALEAKYLNATNVIATHKTGDVAKVFL